MSSSVLSSEGDITSIIDDTQAAMSATAFGARVREAAARFRYKAADLHRETGVSRQTVSTWWNGKKVPEGQNLIALASALDVDPQWLLFGLSNAARDIVARAHELGEQGQKEEAARLIPNLQRIALNPDTPPDLAIDADMALRALGDKDAQKRYIKNTQAAEKAWRSVETIVAAAIQQFEQDTATRINTDAVRRLQTMCQSLLHQQIQSFDPFWLRSMVIELLEMLLGGRGSTLHDRRRGFKHEP